MPISIPVTRPSPPPTSTKRKAALSPPFADAPVFISPFTSPFVNPASSASCASYPPRSTYGMRRQHSSEGRAVAANRMKAGIIAVETAPGKRRKSVVELEEATEGMRTLAARRRSSLSPIQPLSTPSRRPSALQFVPVHGDLLEDRAPPLRAVPTRSHLRTTSGVPISFPLAFPSPSPRSPTPTPSSPVIERRTAFSDESRSPTFSSPPPVQFSPSSPSTYPNSPTPSAAPSCRSSTSCLVPRSPRIGSTRELSPDGLEEDCARSAQLRSPTGVPCRWPPVFPARSRPTSMVSNSTLDIQLGESEDESESDDDEEEQIVYRQPAPFLVHRRLPPLSLPSLTRRLPPPTLSSASPFPPPFPATLPASSADSFSNFVFPSMPTLFVKTPSALPSRRTSNCSSYESDTGAQTPSTLEFQARTPLGTGQSLYSSDVFADAFGRAGAAAEASGPCAETEEPIESIV